MSIGIDFGTTKSALSYFENGVITLYSPGAAASGVSNSSIPTVVSQDERGNSLFGHQALRASRSLANKIRRYFKLGLDRNDEQSASQVNDATSFLGELMASFIREVPAFEVDNIVITIPEMWKRESSPAFKNIRSIATKLELPMSKIVSEPVAGCCYFLGQYEANNGTTYQGNVLVFDHGGGTLDVSMLRVDANNEVSCIDGFGLGKEVSEQGFGGLYYDATLVGAAIDFADVTISVQQREEMINSFAEEKVIDAARIADAISAYLQDKTIDDAIFDLNVDQLIVPIKPSMLVDVYEEAIRGQCEQPLVDFICSYIESPEFDLSAGITILPIGGFSCFKMADYLIQDVSHRVAQNTENKAQISIDKTLSLVDRQYAVSKGACLYAAERVKVRELCPISFGLVVEDDQGIREKCYLFKRGEQLERYLKPEVVDMKLSLNGRRDQLMGRRIKFFRETMNSTRDVFLTVTPADLLPNYFDAGYWRFSGLLKEDLSMNVLVSDDKNETKEIYLGDLLRSGDDD